MKLDAATISQNRAASPHASTWLSANAGSGKTRVLTDRVARLLLDGVPPQNILCLTYTKAAASEMQNRLFQRLGGWAMKPDGALAEELQKMGERDLFDAARLAEARRLFAGAIETPGGLRIQTIHSLCASLLRRFPLEAQVSPDFAEMDERASELLRQEVVEEIARGPEASKLDALALHYTAEDMSSLTQEIVQHRATLGPVDEAELLRWFGVSPGADLGELLAQVFDASTAPLMTKLLAMLRKSHSPNDLREAERLGAIDWTCPDEAALMVACTAFLTGPKAKPPFSAKIGQIPTKACRDAHGPLTGDLDGLMRRVEAARPVLVALQAARRTRALCDFAAEFLPRYEARKQALGVLDFDDLIDRTRALLADPDVADWVLFRLDGGLDHILVDEAQDTSPAQWQVIERLAHEFAAGRGAREDVRRTIFVVGDKKQSIYSFQGADPEGFDRMRDLFRTRLQGAGLEFQQRELEYSFRSSGAILDVVESVIQNVPRAGMDADTEHRAFHGTMPGRVDLWPLEAPAEAPEKGAWYDPVDMPAPDQCDVVLARKIARFIAETIGTETIPRPNGTRREVRAGDFLILVRRRALLFSEVIRACKAEGLPVAGADRLKLGGELAVRDLAALLSFLATPEDSLSLAACLRSPLFGWSEGDLYDLAAGRNHTYLWQELRRAADRYPETLAILNDLRAQTDYLRPFDLVERILSRHDGRRRLLARLGPEAEDGIDQLLSQALSYERREVPSLTGFLAWLETDDIEIKRQLDNAGDRIRVMTVHGAKGLESPIVMLPDSGYANSPNRDQLVLLENGRTVWKSKAEWQPGPMQAALDRRTRDQKAERLRLLYVAMTRAETWLIVAAAGKVSKNGDCWHDVVRLGLERLGADPLATPVGEGLRYATHGWHAPPVGQDDIVERAPPLVPDWADIVAPAPERIAPVRPSDLGGAKALGREVAEFDLDAALLRGRQVHLLLEHLPCVSRERWRSVASALLADTAMPEEVPELLAEAQSVLDAPELGWLFAPGVLSEVDVSAALPSLEGRRMHGTIDKLIVEPDRVLAVDFKTNRIVPNRAEEVPSGLLRQMAAYADALRQIYPGRAVETAILWTVGPSLMRLPHEVVSAALESCATS